MGQRIAELITVLGAILTGSTGWYVVRGPFFGYPVPPVEYMLVAAGAFLVGTIVTAGGLSRSVSARTGDDRTVISEGKT